jgi:hypothetical protein
VRGTELKVVYPAYDPLAYESIARNFEHRFVSPEAVTMPLVLGVSSVARATEESAAQFCMAHPRWRLSLQTHKHLGLP